MSQAAVFDASTMLALIFNEPGASIITKTLLRNSFASTVNLAEVQFRLVMKGYLPEVAWRDTLSSVSKIEPYTAEQAKIAGTLISQTKAFGLSLGDRSCLALAKLRNAAVYTADRSWLNIQVGVPIHVIR